LDDAYALALLREQIRDAIADLAAAQDDVKCFALGFRCRLHALKVRLVGHRVTRDTPRVAAVWSFLADEFRALGDTRAR
jgi:hypothetical protein